MSDLSPFAPSLVEHEPRFALVIYHSKHLMFHSSNGPFQALRLVIFADGEWRLDCPIFEHCMIAGGAFSVPNEKSVPKELMEIVKEYLFDKHVLCPGLLEVSDLNSELGYIPKTVRLFNGQITTVHSKACKIWHIPAKNVKSKGDESDSRQKRVCGDCLIASHYVQIVIQKKQEMDLSKRHERQQPSSNYPIKYLSPKSKTARYSNSRLQRHRLDKHIKKLYKGTKVELPQEQSAELCLLIDSIENPEEGKKELLNIFSEGNQVKGEKGQKAGD